MADEVIKILEGAGLGAVLTVALAPAVNFGNYLSVAACAEDSKPSTVCRKIYKGGGKHSLRPYPSGLNFLCGMKPHLAKEAPRQLFKPFGLYNLKPILDANFNPEYAILMFAAFLSFAEVLVNPADSIRVQLQSGRPIDYSFKALMTGSLGNGTRQFLTWSIFGSVSRFVDKKILKPHKIDSSSSTGLIINSICVATSLGCIYPIESIKNARQYAAAPQSYVSTARSIYKRGGPSCLFRGATPKVISHFFQAMGASALVSMGNARNSKQINGVRVN